MYIRNSRQISLLNVIATTLLVMHVKVSRNTINYSLENPGYVGIMRTLRICVNEFMIFNYRLMDNNEKSMSSIFTIKI